MAACWTRVTNALRCDEMHERDRHDGSSLVGWEIAGDIPRIAQRASEQSTCSKDLDLYYTLPTTLGSCCYRPAECLGIVFAKG